MRQEKRGYWWTLAVAAGAGLFALVAPDSAAAADQLCVDPVTGIVDPTQKTQAQAAPGDQVICGAGATATGGGGIAIGKASSLGADGIAIGTGTNAGQYDVAIGRSAGTASGAGRNVTIGFSAGQATIGGNQVFLGEGAGQGLGVGTHAVCPTGSFFCTGHPIGGGGNNVGIGTHAARGAKGALNSYIGWKSGEQTDGFNNVGNGVRTLYNSVGSGNVGIGNETGRGLQGNYNTSVGINSGRYVSGDDNIAIGNNAGSGSETAKHVAKKSIAIGADSMAATESVAIGTGAQATGKQSIAIGHQSQVTGNNSGAFGDPNVVSGNASYAFGNDNKIESDRVMVLGNDVTVGPGMDGAVVLGDGSAATPAMGVTGVTIAGQDYNFAGATNADGQIVSVGAEGAERQVKHVAAGQLSATSTDAVNGSQLHATNSRIETLNTALGDSNTVAAATNQRLDGVADRVGAAETRIDGLTGRMGRAETRIESLDSRLRRHQTSTTNRFQQVNQRIDRADSQIVALGGRLDDLTRDVGVKHQGASKNCSNAAVGV